MKRHKNKWLTNMSCPMKTQPLKPRDEQEQFGGKKHMRSLGHHLTYRATQKVLPQMNPQGACVRKVNEFIKHM